jgi:hypothetical protein
LTAILRGIDRGVLCNPLTAAALAGADDNDGISSSLGVLFIPPLLPPLTISLGLAAPKSPLLSL